MPALFSLRSDSVQLVWSRRQARGVLPAGPSEAPLAVRTAAASEGPEVVVHDPATRLFEQTDYVLFAQSRTGAPIRLRHRDPVLLRPLQRSPDGTVVHGVLNFGAQVGRSRFAVEVDGRRAFTFEVEVFPSKLDYRRDYEALQADVAEVSADLVLEYLRATYRVGRGRPEGRPGVPGWLLLLRHLADDLEAGLRHAAAHPQWETAPLPDAVRAERLRRPDAGVRRRLRQAERPGPHLALAQGPPVPARLLARPPRYTLDTPSHCWLHRRLARLQADLAALVAAERRRPPTPRRAQAAAELDVLRQRLARWLAVPPLHDAAGEPPPEPPLRLTTAPGYREAYRACLALAQGLHLSGGPVELGVKDLHLLYEYWCFLTLVRVAASCAGRRLPAAQLLTAERHGLRYRLRQGQRHAVRLRLGGGRRLTLVYNPRFGGRGYLVPQQPDVVLTLRHADGTRVRYVVDAKYRIDATPGYVRRYGTPGPPAEALNTLHRYRDAIRSRGTGPVVQAVALFPYREPTPGAFAASRHGRALAEVGVGALPLLPGATHHLEAWLRGVLATDRADG